MINYLLAMDSPPQVLTTSYAFDETGLDAGSANTLCNAYMQLGARGTSIVNCFCVVYGKLADPFNRSSSHQVMVVSLEYSPKVAPTSSPPSPALALSKSIDATIL